MPAVAAALPVTQRAGAAEPALGSSRVVLAGPPGAIVGEYAATWEPASGVVK